MINDELVSKKALSSYFSEMRVVSYTRRLQECAMHKYYPIMPFITSNFSRENNSQHFSFCLGIGSLKTWIFDTLLFTKAVDKFQTNEVTTDWLLEIAFVNRFSEQYCNLHILQSVVLLLMKSPRLVFFVCFIFNEFLLFG